MDNTAKKPKVGAIGESGTIAFQGIISGEEYNSNLWGWRALDVFDQMRKGDGTVSAALKAIKLPIMAADWQVEAASDNPADIKAANIVRHDLFEAISWDDLLRQALTELDFGFSVFEMVPTKRLWDKTQYFGLALEPRKQRTILSWKTRDQQPGITQQTANGTFDIPADRLAVFTNEQEGDNYQGVSLLRPAYMHWFYKNGFYKVDAVRIERLGGGVPKAIEPADANPADQARVDELLENLRTNEKSYARLPYGWDFEWMDLKASTTAGTIESVTHHDRQILKTVLAQFLDIGASGSGGSYAASNDQIKLITKSEEAVAKHIASVITNTAVKWIVDYNVSGVTGYPKVTFGQIGDKDIEQLSKAIAELADKQLITPDPDLEQSLRTTLKLPDLPDDYREDYANRPGAQPTAIPAVTKVETNTDDDSNITASESLKQARLKAQAAKGKLIDVLIK